MTKIFPPTFQMTLPAPQPPATSTSGARANALATGSNLSGISMDFAGMPNT